MPEQLTVTAALARMPEGHYDGEFIAPFMFRSKYKNSHAANGYMTDTRFFAEDFGQALVDALGGGWKLKRDESQFNYPTECAQLEKGDSRITIRAKGYGAGAYQKLTLSSWVKSFDHRAVSGPGISVAASKDVATIAKDVARRMMPFLSEAEAKASAEIAKGNAERAALESMLAKLQWVYPDLKFNIGDAGRGQNDRNLYLGTKYGSKISVHATIYRNGERWCLSGGHGTGQISIDDLDSAHGRAFLKLVND